MKTMFGGGEEEQDGMMDRRKARAMSEDNVSLMSDHLDCDNLCLHGKTGFWECPWKQTNGLYSNRLTVCQHRDTNVETYLTLVNRNKREPNSR